MTISFLSAQGWTDSNNLGATYTMSGSASPADNNPTTIPGGSFGLLAYYTSDGSTGNATGLTDSGGNAWSTGSSLYSASASNGTVGLIMGQVATALPSGTGTVKPTWSNSNYDYLILDLLAFSGVATSTPQDGTLETMAAAYANAYTLGTALSYSAGDLVVGVFCQPGTDNQACTPPSGYSKSTLVHSSSKHLDVIYGIPSTAGSITNFGSLAAYANNAFGMAAAFKKAAGPTPNPQVAAGFLLA